MAILGMAIASRRAARLLRAVTSIVAGSLVMATTAMAQGGVQQDNDKKLPVVVVEEPRILDPVLKGRGITGRTLAETLLFILSNQPGLRASLTIEPDAPNGQFRLTSSVSRAQSLLVWSGELSDLNNARRGSIGPVTISDGNGMTSGGFSTVASLVQAFVRQPSDAGAQSVDLSVGCFATAGKLAAAALDDYKTRLRARFERVPGTRDGGEPKCGLDQETLDRGSAVVGGQLNAEDNDKIIVRPILSRRSPPGALALPLYTGSFADYLDDRDEHLGLVVKTVAAILGRQYAEKAVSDAIDASSMADEQAIEKGLSFMKGEQLYLALPLLQRGAASPRGEVVFNLAMAYEKAGAVREAEKTFRSVLKLTDYPPQPTHLELGKLLFGRRDYKQAAEQFDKAGDIPDARPRLATTLTLLNQLPRARTVALDAMKAGESKDSLTLLIAQLDMADGQYREAINRLNVTPSEGFKAPYLSALASVAEAASRAKQDDVVDDAFKMLLARSPMAYNYLIYGRKLVERANRLNSPPTALRASEMFQKALDLRGDGAAPASDPELGVVRVELAEALFLAGKTTGAAKVASDFIAIELKTDSGAKPSGIESPTKSRFLSVAKLIAVSSSYLDGSLKEAPMQALQRGLPDKLPYPELALVISSSSKDTPSTTYPLSRWGFLTFNKYICNSIPKDRRKVVVELATFLEKKVSADELGDFTEDICKTALK